MGLDIIVATRNRRSKLLNLLDSLESQTNKEFQVIIADDSSDDGAKEAIEKRQKKSYNTTYLRQTRRGAATARNLAIKNTSGELLLFLNDDVIADRNLIEEHMKFHKLNPGTSNLGWIKPTSETKKNWFLDVRPHFDPKTIPYHLDDLPCLYFITANVLVERETVLAAGLFDESFKEAYGEDIELGYRLQNMGVKLSFNRNAVVYHDHPLSALEFARQQYMRGIGYAKFILKQPEARYMPGFDMENNAKNVLKETARTVESLYGIKIKPGIFRLLVLSDLPMWLITKYLNHAMKSDQKDQLELYTLQKLVWMHYLSKGYDDYMESTGHKTPELE